jgi:hypothetical protein
MAIQSQRAGMLERQSSEAVKILPKNGDEMPTMTLLPSVAPNFESSASANSATPANILFCLV